MPRKKVETTVVEETTQTISEQTETVTEPEEFQEELPSKELQKTDKALTDDTLTEPESTQIPNDVPEQAMNEDTLVRTWEETVEANADDTVLPEPEPILTDDVPQNTAPRRRGTPRERVITIDGKVYDGRTRQSSTVTEIRRDIQRGNILRANLYAVDQTSGGMPYGVLLYKDMRVIIPAAELVNLDQIQVDEDTTIEREANAVLNGMLDAEIEFVPKGISAADGIITGSRREAMEKQAKRFYLTPAISGQPLIIENGLAEGKIIRVTTHTVTVELFGVDTVIVGEELSWSWLNDAREVYHVGETVVVRVLKIDIQGSEIVVTASIRMTEKDPYIDLEKKLQIRRNYVGEIQSPGNRFIRVKLDNLDCMCPYPDWMDAVIPGTKVSVKVVSINPDLHRIRGSITRVIKEV